MLNVRRPSALLLAVTLVVSPSACGDGARQPTEPSLITTVTVIAATPELAPGQSTQLAATATTAAGQVVTAAEFTWLSETPAVATVDAAGRVTAVSPGAAVLAATAGKVRGTVTITVRVVPVASLTLTPGTADVFVGSTLPISAQARDSANTVLPGRTITWTTDNAAVAWVSAGLVTGISTGTATISATSEGRTATARVTVSKRPLSSIVDSVRHAFQLPAMGAAIVTLEDGITAIAAAGMRRVTGGASVTTDDLWHLGSNTKAVTSMLAAVAVSQNRIQWTTTIAEVFPELAIRTEYRDITLRELLSHQSGLGIPSGGMIGSDTTGVSQRASMVASVVQQPPGGPRGTFSYSNVGYVTAGTMLERVFGTSFEAAVAEQVFAPLGMTAAGFGPQAAVGSTTQPVAHRQQSDGSWSVLEGFDYPPVFGPSGSMHMSLPSWGRFIREILRVEAGTSTLAPAAVARQTTSAVISVNATTSYGMGWNISTRAWANGKVLFHDGTNTGNGSLTFVAPLRNVAFLATTNGFDEAGQSLQALDALIARLITFYNTGQ